MDLMPEPGRLAAHALIDAVCAYEIGGEEAGNVSAMNLAVSRLDEIEGAVPVTGTDGPMTIDLSNLVGASIVTMNWLVERVATARGTDRHAVIAELREFLDS